MSTVNDNYENLIKNLKSSVIDIYKDISKFYFVL